MNRCACGSPAKKNILICEEYIERLETYRGRVTMPQLITLYRAVDFAGTEDDARVVCACWFRDQVMLPRMRVGLDGR